MLSSSLFSLLLAACGRDEGPREGRGAAAPNPQPRVVTLTGRDAAATPEALLDTVEARVFRADTAGLVRLMIDDSSFRRYVYPLSDAYDSTRQQVFEFVLGMNKANSNKGLRRLMFDATQPGAAALEPAWSDSARALDGVVYELATARPGQKGLRLVGSVLCLPAGCQVVSYGSAGAAGE